MTPIIIHEAKHQGDMQRLRATTGLPCPDPASSDAALPGISETHVEWDGRYTTAPSHLLVGSIPHPSRVAPASTYPRRNMQPSSSTFRHAIQVLSLVGDGCRFLGLPPPLHDMLLTGVRSAVPSSQRLLSIGSDGSTSAPLSAARLLAPAARACISVNRRRLIELSALLD